MAITIVGTGQVGSSANGGNVTLTFDGTPAEDDVVVLIGGHSDNATPGSAGPSTAGYTELARYTANGMDIGVWYKVLGVSPDASVTGQGDGVAQHAAAYISYVLRGVDTTTPSDATPVEQGETADGAAFDPPAITTVTDGAWVIASGFDYNTVNNPTGGPTGYSNFLGVQVIDSVRFILASATKEVASAGSENPGAFTDDGTTNGRYEITVAIRPAVAGGAPTLTQIERHYPRGSARGVLRGVA